MAQAITSFSRSGAIPPGGMDTVKLGQLRLKRQPSKFKSLITDALRAGSDEVFCGEHLELSHKRCSRLHSTRSSSMHMHS